LKKFSTASGAILSLGSSAAINIECGLGFSRRCDWLAAQPRSSAGEK
jgi:hypothetical protein